MPSDAEIRAALSDPDAVIAWCGPAKGERLEFRCQSCGFESDSIEDFNASTCWECCERASWGDLCQQERHGECKNGDPDGPEFCPCPCHDREAAA